MSAPGLACHWIVDVEYAVTYGLKFPGDCCMSTDYRLGKWVIRTQHASIARGDEVVQPGDA